MLQLFADLFAEVFVARPIERFFEDALPRSGLDDPVYKKNVQRLIERNRSFEETKE